VNRGTGESWVHPLGEDTHLETLRLSHCDVPEAQIEALRVALPDTKIL
jgi:hypothetical protein